MSVDCLVAVSERLARLEHEPLNCESCALITFFNLAFNALSLAEIIIGFVNMDACPLQPMVPVYLVGECS